MEEVKPFDKWKIPDVKINPELEKYRDVILFPEQHAKAQELFKKLGITDRESLLKKIKSLTEK